jgi:hypothetical protein
MLLVTLPARAGGPDTDAPTEGPQDEAAMKPAARALYEQGLERFRKKEYAGATRAFEEGYALDPRPEFLFADAQARRLAGDCRGAVPLYQRFLEKSPTPVQTSATHIALARCAQQMAREKPVTAPPPAPVVPPAPPPPWWRDRAGAALLGAGVLALAVGGGFLASAHAARPPDDGLLFPDYRSRFETAERRQTIGIVTLAAGGALVAGGAARYLVVRHRNRSATLTIVPGGLALAGSF